VPKSLAVEVCCWACLADMHDSCGGMFHSQTRSFDCQCAVHEHKLPIRHPGTEVCGGVIHDEDVTNVTQESARSDLPIQ